MRGSDDTADSNASGLNMPGLVVREAERGEAHLIADLIRRAFEVQCELYGDWSLPPARESEEVVAEAMRVGIVLVVEDSGTIVGTVRAKTTETGVEIGRLAVEPDLRGQGIGRLLTEVIETYYPDATRFELITGHRSKIALSLYESLGYVRISEEPVHDRLSLVRLEKSI